MDKLYSIAFEHFYLFRWVMFVEKKICDVDGKLMIYHENLKRLRKRLDILKQVHDAPSVYGKLVVEVCRRKKFSQNYNKVGMKSYRQHSYIHVTLSLTSLPVV